MRRNALTVRKKGQDKTRAEITECATKMGLGPNGANVYRFGHGNVFYDIWELLSDEEQHQARLQIQASSFTTCGACSLTTAERVSVDAQYICAEKMNAEHEHFLHPAFYSHRLGHAVCGAPLAIERRRVKQGWRHACKSGQQNPSGESGSRRWPKKEGKFFFHVCASCQAAKRAEGICNACAYEHKVVLFTHWTPSCCDYTERQRRYTFFRGIFSYDISLQACLYAASFFSITTVFFCSKNKEAVDRRVYTFLWLQIKRRPGHPDAPYSERSSKVVKYYTTSSNPEASAW